MHSRSQVGVEEVLACGPSLGNDGSASGQSPSEAQRNLRKLISLKTLLVKIPRLRAPSLCSVLQHDLHTPMHSHVLSL